MTKEGMGDEAMKKSLFYRAKKMPSSAQIMLLFAVEGVFLQYITSINGFGLNLYATNMGATDSQIGIIQMVPNIVACAALLPLGILADRLKSTKTIPMLTLLVMCAGYAFLGSVPALGERRMELFFVSLAFTAGALAIYNAQWQAMFGAAVSLRQRNDVYAFRNQFMFVIGILAPVICGILMGRCHTADGKLLVLRSFFYLCAVCVLLQAAAIKKIPVEQQEEGKAPAEAGKASSRFSVSDLLEAITSVGKNKALRWFFVPVVFFYITWQLDWSMWYLGQVKYCKMSEMTLSICNGVFNIGQLAAVGIIAKVVRKKIAGFCTDFRRDRSLLLPGYYDFGSTFTAGVPRGYFYCSDDGSERSTVCRCTLYGTDSFKCRTGKEPFAFDQPLYDDDDADQQCSAVAWCPSVYGTWGRSYGTVPVQSDRSWGSHFIHTRAGMALSEGEKRWLSDKDFGLRRAVKAENNIYNRNDIVYDKCGFLCTYGKEKRKKEFKQ